MSGGQNRAISRRTAVRALGMTAAAGVLAGSGMLTGAGALAKSTSPARRTLTVDSWVAVRGNQYYIAHRGSGDVLPEHSMPAYQAAVDWGAQCLEISVGITSDGVLICMHDATYDRTTTGKGGLIDQPSSVLETIRIWQPRLGEAWTRQPPRVPLFEDVLRTFGGTVVLAVEAKVPEAYEPMMAMVQRRGLEDSVIVKAHHANTQVAQAKSAGYPVFSYFGSAEEATVEAITASAAVLDPRRDHLVIPGYRSRGAYLPDDIVATAVGTGVPVWVHPLHRRVDVRHFFDRGVAGAICSSYGHLSGAVQPVTADSWAGQAISSGEMTKNPASDTFAPHFTADGDLVLGAQGTQHFLAMGQCGAIPTSSPTTIELDLSWTTLPADSSDNLTVAFGRVDDSYYEHRQGKGDGYHAVLHADGSLGLYRHRDGQQDGEPLCAAVATPALRAGQWAHLRITITASGIELSRTDVGATLTVASAAVNDGYLHVGRSSPDGAGAFRALRIS